MNTPDPKEYRSFAIPTTLVFPVRVFEQLEELCEERELTPGQLIAEALKGQLHRFEEFTQEIMGPGRDDPGAPWPDDALYCLARVVMVYSSLCLIKSVEDPVAYNEQKNNAPAEWSFEPVDDADPADWWKTHS